MRKPKMIVNWEEAKLYFMRKPKMSVNWEEAKLYFLYRAEERNLHPPRQKLTDRDSSLLRRFSDRRRFAATVDLLAAKSMLSRKELMLQDFQCVYNKNNFI